MAARSILAVLAGQAPETVVNPACVDAWMERFAAR